MLAVAAFLGKVVATATVTELVRYAVSSVKNLSRKRRTRKRP
ncbi:hypothetical protein LzC2_36260 [Planctomycetes bacterium LzC2]|uniref:Uncharacterized protein n=1 Tax=Alienimonas chondri TaxID=2681879 RepID=A0ABX1VHG6_9PLAN|nr:hypothetical protein [Alienimonas chondri]